MAEKKEYAKFGIYQFLEEIAREVPTLPAGGCVSALAGALAAALERFVLRLSLEREEDGANREDAKEILSRIVEIQHRCLGLMDSDTRAFENVIRSMHLSADTPKEKKERKSELEKALKQATVPPITLMKYGKEMLQYAQILVEKGFSAAIADSVIAAELAHACFWGSFWIVKSNLAGISDQGFVKKKEMQIEMFRDSAEQAYRSIREKLRKRVER